MKVCFIHVSVLDTFGLAGNDTFKTITFNLISLAIQSVYFTHQQIDQVNQVYNLISSIVLSISQSISWLDILINENQIKLIITWQAQVVEMKNILIFLQSSFGSATTVQLTMTEKILLVNALQNFSTLQGQDLSN